MLGHDTTVYVANLPWRTTEDDLCALFQRYGPIVDARVIQDAVTGRSRGYGFVQLATPAQVEAAVAELDGLTYQGRCLLVSPARPKPRRP